MYYFVSLKHQVFCPVTVIVFTFELIGKDVDFCATLKDMHKVLDNMYGIHVYTIVTNG